MSDPGREPNSDSDSRSEYPIEQGFPIVQVNDLADRERRAKLHYRPLTTMHKWWAGQLGSVFRAISLYTLLDDPTAVTVREPGQEPSGLDAFLGADAEEDEPSKIERAIESVSLGDPDSLWELYSKDVQVANKTVLDPFMGSATSLVEAIRFGADVTGIDLDPVAWFMTKKELEAHTVDIDRLEEAFATVEAAVADELRSQYETACPHDEGHTADVVYALWVRKLDCTSCGNTVRLFKDYRVAKGRYENDHRHSVYCPCCEAVFLTDDYTTETVCPDCSSVYVPADGPVSRGGMYGCPSCGLKYPIVDALAEGQSYAEELYAIEYYCTDCEDKGKDRSTYKGHKPSSESDVQRYEQATEKFHFRDDLDAYVPRGSIPRGAITASSSVSGNDVFRHGYGTWRDMFNDRQLYCLSSLLSAIDDVEKQDCKEYLLLAFSDSLLFNSTFAPYNAAGTKIESVFRGHSYTPLLEYAENNVWGTRAGRGTFSNTWEKVLGAVEFAHHPTERYLEDGALERTKPFETPVGGEYTLHQGDSSTIDPESEYDVILTDPPYYDNVVYSEVSNFFYVWQRLLLGEEHSCFDAELVPSAESLVENPAIGKSSADFEAELEDAFARMRAVLNDDGILVFTYRHGGAKSWGELLGALCEVGFDVTATYPISGSLDEFVMGEELSFTVVVVCRPAREREPTSWSSLRRRMHRVAREVREELRHGRPLSEGDVGVVEMGRCFREYCTHHGELRRDGAVMSATEAVEGIYDLIARESSPDGIYLQLRSMDDPTDDDRRRLCRGTHVDGADLGDRGLIRTDGEFEVAGWDDDGRIAYLRDVPAAERTALEEVHWRRFVASRPPGTADGSENSPATGPMIDIAEELAAATGDDEYRRLFRD